MSENRSKNPNRVAEVNRILRERFGKDELVLRRGRDYYYLSGPRAGSLPETAIYIFRASDLSLDLWMTEIDNLLKAAY